VTDTRALQKGFVLLVPALLFGLLVAAQWGTFASAVRNDIGIRYVEPLNVSVAGLQTQQDELKAELAALRTELETLQRTAVTQTGATQGLQARLDQLRTLSGLTAVRGEGLLVTLDAVPAQAGPPDRPVCFAPDLTDIINAAWRAGATAVSLNGERVVVSSSVYCVGSTIVVNGALTAAPFEIAAVGDGAKLLAALDEPQQLRDLKRRRDERSVVFRTSRQPDVAIGAYTGPIAVRAAAIE
jgi:uncharacterized protein YlxW (UPF0749 family)